MKMSLGNRGRACRWTRRFFTLRSVVISSCSVREISNRDWGSRVPHPNTLSYVLNHSKTISCLRTCMHAIILKAPGSGKKFET